MDSQNLLHSVLSLSLTWVIPKSRTSKMHLPLVFLFLTSLNLVSSLNLNITAITASPNNKKTHFQCWQLSDPFAFSNQPGIIGTANTFLGDVVNMTYNVIPAGYDSGFHTVPTNQWAIVLSGTAEITISSSNQSVITTGDELAIFFFTDTAEISKRGHGTSYPGISETIFLQIPGAVPEHEVLLDDGPCRPVEYSGLRGLAGKLE
ncbi:hypothetical protein GGS20DRAFT_550287 [Poronia punctata]|nr:hypothetical protein GGS20DRAFT_550287 [Poronia punctata]